MAYDQHSQYQPPQRQYYDNDHRRPAQQSGHTYPPQASYDSRPAAESHNYNAHQGEMTNGGGGYYQDPYREPDREPYTQHAPQSPHHQQPRPYPRADAYPAGPLPTPPRHREPPPSQHHLPNEKTFQHDHPTLPSYPNQAAAPTQTYNHGGPVMSAPYHDDRNQYRHAPETNHPPRPSAERNRSGATPSSNGRHGSGTSPTPKSNGTAHYRPLEHAPRSPQELGWDNPFPSFPGAGAKKAHNIEQTELYGAMDQLTLKDGKRGREARELLDDRAHGLSSDTNEASLGEAQRPSIDSHRSHTRPRPHHTQSEPSQDQWGAPSAPGATSAPRNRRYDGSDASHQHPGHNRHDPSSPVADSASYQGPFATSQSAPRSSRRSDEPMYDPYHGDTPHDPYSAAPQQSSFNQLGANQQAVSAYQRHHLPPRAAVSHPEVPGPLVRARSDHGPGDLHAVSSIQEAAPTSWPAPEGPEHTPQVSLGGVYDNYYDPPMRGQTSIPRGDRNRAVPSVQTPQEEEVPNFDAAPLRSPSHQRGMAIDEHLPGLNSKPEPPLPPKHGTPPAGYTSPLYYAPTTGFAAQAHRSRSQPDLRAQSRTPGPLPPMPGKAAGAAPIGQAVFEMPGDDPVSPSLSMPLHANSNTHAGGADYDTAFPIPQGGYYGDDASNWSRDAPAMAIVSPPPRMDSAPGYVKQTPHSRPHAESEFGASRPYQSPAGPGPAPRPRYGGIAPPGPDYGPPAGRGRLPPGARGYPPHDAFSAPGYDVGRGAPPPMSHQSSGRGDPYRRGGPMPGHGPPSSGYGRGEGYPRGAPPPRAAGRAYPSFTGGRGVSPISDGLQAPPGARPMNPNALPAHPAPVRPGLMPGSIVNLSTSRPNPSQRPALVHSNSVPSGRSGAPLSVDLSTDAGSRLSTPVTHTELDQLQSLIRSNPSDFANRLLLAKKYVEAASTLVDERDPKTRARTRERYILDAHKLVKRLVGDGDAEAAFYLADCYGQGRLGLEVDAREAYSLYSQAAKAGHAQAAYRTAVCCELGMEDGGGTKKDPLKAIQWYKRAASMGDPPAMYKMGMILLKGLLGQQASPREAITWLKRAAERADADNPHALHELGLLYEGAASANGRDYGIIPDEVYSRQLFTQAADLGYKFSQFRLGCAYEYGLLGCAIDPRVSIQWYSLAAVQEEHQSELALSGWYLTGGEGVLGQSDTEAYLWARKAAQAGLAKAEYAMGYFTEVGIGAPASLEEAKVWYWRAAAQNFPKARERLDELRRGGTKGVQKKRERMSRSDRREGECAVM